MNISYNWLKNHINLTLSPEETAKKLTSLGLEVGTTENVQSIKGGLEGLVVAKVVECEDHPNSDHLHITKVDAGNGELLQVVCGAANCRAGLTTILATVGTKLYSGDESFAIKKSKIRGVESFGMLCAEDEIGIGTSHDGIIELPEDAVIGTPAKEYYNIEDDTLIEVDITPNRSDAISHFGVARDLAAGLGIAVTKPSVDDFKVDNNDYVVNVTVENSEACPRYSGVTINNVKVTESPDWLKNKLSTIGLRPINNVVDVTNFILHELGQPLHAFDGDKIKGNHIIVKNLADETPFTTLDGVERKLSSNDLMICNEAEGMCIAGVFGGLDSGVTESTTKVFIESAYFNPVSVRKTARRHSLNTDASFRYERGCDPNITLYALKRAALLIQEVAGGQVSMDIVDIYPNPIQDFSVQLSYAKVNSLIGKELSKETVKGILAGLEIKIENETDTELSLLVPPYRTDVRRDVDVIEDILRIYGYNNVEIPEHVNSTLSYVQKPDRNRLVNMVSDMLTARGYTEIMSNSLTKAAYYDGLECYKAENCVKILNPLSADLNVMRQTLAFNVLEAVALNINHKNADLKLYEAGNCYYYNAEAATEENPLAAYSENYRLAIAVTGNESAPSWNCKSAAASFFTLRASVELLLKRFGLNIYDLKCESCNFDIFGDAICLYINNKPLVWMGQISGKLCKTMGIKQDVFFAEIDFELLVKATRKHKITVTELSKYPEVKRDLALLVDKNVNFSALRAIAFATERKLLKSVSLFDVYEGDKLPEGKKSYALSFILEDKSQTLTDKAIERTMANLQAAFEKQTGATIR